MAKQPIDIGVKFTADDSGFKRAAVNVGKSAKEIKSNIKDTAGVFDELGSAISGIGGNIAGLISSIMTATGPLALMAIAVGAIANAWKESKENIAAYLIVADKLKYGFAGYNQDAEKEREATKKRAKGMISAGEASRSEAGRIQGSRSSSAEEKEIAKAMHDQANDQIREGVALYNSVTHWKEIITWKLKYNELLQEQETINDRINGVDNIRWEGMETELANLRLISKTSNNIKEVADAKNKAEEIAATLLKEKNASIEGQLNNIIAIAEITGTLEATEKERFALQQQMATNTTKYTMDLLKINRFMKDASVVAKEQLDIQKAFNTHTEEGYKFGTIKDKTGDRLIKGLNLGDIIAPAGAGNLSPYKGNTPGEIKEISDQLKIMNGELGYGPELVNTLQNSFEGFFANIGGGFAGMAVAFSNAIKQMAAELAAKAAIFGIFALLFPESLLFKSFGSFGSFMFGSSSGKMIEPSIGMSSGVSKIQIQGVTKGDAIYWSNARYGNSLGRNS